MTNAQHILQNNNKSFGTAKKEDLHAIIQRETKKENRLFCK